MVEILQQIYTNRSGLGVGFTDVHWTSSWTQRVSLIIGLMCNTYLEALFLPRLMICLGGKLTMCSWSYEVVRLDDYTSKLQVLEAFTVHCGKVSSIQLGFIRTVLAKNVEMNSTYSVCQLGNWLPEVSLRNLTQLDYLTHGAGVFGPWLSLSYILDKEGLDETEVPAFSEVKELSKRLDRHIRVWTWETSDMGDKWRVWRRGYEGGQE